MSKKITIENVYPEFASISSIELMEKLLDKGTSNEENIRITNEIEFRTRKNVFKVLYYVLTRKKFRPGVNIPAENNGNEILEAIYSDLQKKSKKFNPLKLKNDIIPFLVELAKAEFNYRTKIDLFITHNSELRDVINLIESGSNDEVSIEYHSEHDRKLKRVIRNLRQYLKENYTKVQIEMVYAYFGVYDFMKKKQHINKDIRKYFRSKGYSDKDRNDFIEKFKRDIRKKFKK